MFHLIFYLFPSSRQCTPFLHFLSSNDRNSFLFIHAVAKSSIFFMFFFRLFRFSHFHIKKQWNWISLPPRNFGWVSEALNICRLCLCSVFCHYFQFSVAFLISVYSSWESGKCIETSARVKHLNEICMCILKALFNSNGSKGKRWKQFISFVHWETILIVSKTKPKSGS